MGEGGVEWVLGGAGEEEEEEVLESDIAGVEECTDRYKLLRVARLSSVPAVVKVFSPTPGHSLVSAKTPPASLLEARASSGGRLAAYDVSSCRTAAAAR